MVQQPQILTIASALARHTAIRQALVAQNIANADTPGYRGRDLEDFSTLFARGGDGAMRASRPGHIGQFASFGLTEPQPVAGGGSMSPNGNDVSLEDEMVRAAAIRQDHDLALSVYRTSLGVLRTSLGRA
ncbi:FlgB family protein [Defluviimonas sp. WL0075]|uniref:FlgB family protein n=1 Tax=Albidovulum sediminicola TaxID=2984331 RepID=A0ABT2Z4N9_9RHOB|nr:FlgB family protein [Defluviimonas sp. WL0075]MCV2866088.1 FlgB family protein [Defluviimonas sp. WL0075]